MSASHLISSEKYDTLRVMYGSVVMLDLTKDKKYQSHSKAFFNKIKNYHKELQQELVVEFEKHYQSKRENFNIKPIEQPHNEIVRNLENGQNFGWKRARYIALLIYGNKCACCGDGLSEYEGVSVDHIKPKSKYPSLATDLRNLQVLCESCNVGKCNWDMTDWRTDEMKLKAIHIMNFPKSIHHYATTDYNDSVH